jgi:hypothetical protein
MERMQSWSNLWYWSGIYLERLRKTTKTVSQDRWSPVDPGLPKYEAGLLRTFG